MNDKHFEKNKHQIRNKDIAMYTCSKFQVISKTPVFGIKFDQKTL